MLRPNWVTSPVFRPDVAPLPRPLRDRPELDIPAAIARAKFAWDTGEALAASGDLAGALAWLDRAHRMAPADENLAFALAWLRLRAGDATGAATLFSAMTRRHDVRECWTGLAASSLQAGDLETATVAVQQALSAHATDAALAAIARQLTETAVLPGWCGVRANGVLLAEAAGSVLDTLLDDHPVEALVGGELPPQWRHASLLHVRAGNVDLLGSPIALIALRRVEGFAERTKHGVSGWAWLPASPELDPVLRVKITSATSAEPTILSITATEPLAEIDGTTPLARPRGFHVTAPLDADIEILGPDGRNLLGSPIRVQRPARNETARLVPRFAQPDLPVDVIVPVHRGLRTTLACLDSVMATVRAPHRIVVVDDHTPEPELARALDKLAASGAIILTRPDGPGGFPSTANAGLRAATGRHAVLLNSDTLVAPFWIETLRAAACSAPDIGTATPLSNEASIFSTPDPAGGNPAPDTAATWALAADAARANGGRLVDVPTAHGFCMFIRQDCLEAAGLLDARSFAQGYGEENDFCERARALGFRHVAVPGVFVAHVGGVSFGGARADLLARNLTILHRLHPDYASRVAAFVEGDFLAPARRRLETVLWRKRARQSTRRSVLLVTHGGGGGTARLVAERAVALRAENLDTVVLRAVDGLCTVDDGQSGTAAARNLSYQLPAEHAALKSLLMDARPVRAELHHLLGHDHAGIMRLLAVLRLPYEVWVHDYAWFCARMSFVTGEDRFCGEAPASVCETCLAKWGRGIEDPIAPADLRIRSAADFRGASRVVVPSADVARRVARHVPGLVSDIVAWEHTPARKTPSVRTGGPCRRVAVVGAIGPEKGFGVLLACARDAAARALALEFVVVGYTVDDETLMATGRAFVTGPFAAAEAGTLIRAQAAHLAFLPSIWPETWCFALTDAWAAGLSAAVFDIGTPAERIAKSGNGWVLPLGLPPPRINDILLAL